MKITTVILSPKFQRFLFFVFLSAWLAPAFSQITAPTADFETITQYTTPLSQQDAIYVFCGPNGTTPAELVAVSEDGTSGWTFTWSKWDSIAGDFSIPVPTLADTSQSIVSNLTDGLYKVVIEKGIETFEDQAWVFNYLDEDKKPSLNLTLLDCDGVHLSSSFEPTIFQYQNIPLPNSFDVNIGFTFTLRRDDETIDNLSLPDYDGSPKTFTDQEPFEDEMTYVMTVRDGCGNTFVSDGLTTETYVVKAGFEVDPMTGEAPLEVSFTNSSINATDYEWFVYQDFDRIIEDALSVEDSLIGGIIRTEENFIFEYMHPGNYFVKLIAKSDKGPEICMDTLMLETPIVVDTSLVDVPNVFTPNGDGRNDIFRVKSQSLRSFHAIVFNRWGRVVYEWKNPDEGWNGRINGKWATPGTYFYVITAEGREERRKKFTKKGSFMLIRK